MKKILLVAGLSALLSSCTSYVRVFDNNNNQIGACMAVRTWFSPPAKCVGTANPGIKILE